MGASKTYQFSEKELNMAKFGRALAHPARVRIIHLLQQHSSCRNTDLTTDLELVKSSVHAHVKKLLDAGLVSVEFYPNCYLIRLNPNVLNYFQRSFN